MKLLILSDSHTNIEAICAATARERPDMVIHLGDHVHDALALRGRFPDLPFHIIRGNTDLEDSYPEEESFEVCGKIIFITHGHRYHVKLGLAELRRRGEAAGADLVLFGHTHKAIIDHVGGFAFMNPGAIGGRVWDRRKTYGVVHIDESGIRCEIAEARL